ncbi:hypothetical protein SAMN05421833_11890 [Microbispora rosea]|uniref:Transposase n=1 Tax=Microbispora rosea TaxID=58117 RepID=A0A1N7EKG8_9ACTN|nr:hypothetical protein Mro03_51880 [Microbispora rosea subsp. rosea]SIR88554.1 hypothetical protein SAMN05421833_11890 [Microbispora rosea]
MLDDTGHAKDGNASPGWPGSTPARRAGSPTHRGIARHEDGHLPECRLPAEWPPGAGEPTDHWLSTLLTDTRLRDLVRLAKIRRRIEHDRAAPTHA